MWNKIFSRLNLIRFGLAIISVAVIVLILPRADHQSFSYELNQPWKYPLLTADFDMPILRDSVSARQMRDSIDKVFIPFVKRDNTVEKANIDKFAQLISHHATANEAAHLIKLMNKVYDDGILDSRIYENTVVKGEKSLRLVDTNNNDSKAVIRMDASKMLSPAKAYGKIDSIYHHDFDIEKPLSPEIVKALNICLNHAFHNVLLCEDAC